MAQIHQAAAGGVESIAMDTGDSNEEWKVTDNPNATSPVAQG